MRHWMSWVIPLLAVLAACGESGAPPAASTSAPVSGVTDTEVLLGSHNDLSGPAALLGVAAINGARMRFDEANAAGGVHGRQIRLIVEDTQYQVPRAIQAVNKLVNRDRIFAMFLGMGTPMNNAVIPTLIEKNVPNLFPISGSRSMVEPFRELQFAARGIYYDEVRAGTRYFLERGRKKPCIVYQDTDYGQEILEGAREQIAAHGLEPAAISAHKPTDTEFTAAILRLRGAGCDLVLMGTVYRDTILLFEAARKMGWTDVQWVGNNASYSQAVAMVESGASEGYAAFVHLPMFYRDDPTLTPEVADWWDRYVARFGVEPEYAAMEGYRNADLVLRALENAGRDLTTDSLVRGIEAIGEITDLFGHRLTFGPGDHKGVDESALSVVVNRRWVTQAESVTY